MKTNETNRCLMMLFHFKTFCFFKLILEQILSQKKVDEETERINRYFFCTTIINTCSNGNKFFFTLNLFPTIVKCSCWYCCWFCFCCYGCCRWWWQSSFVSYLALIIWDHNLMIESEKKNSSFAKRKSLSFLLFLTDKDIFVLLFVKKRWKKFFQM